MTEDTRGGNGRFTRSIETAKRDASAAALRSRGCSYQQIADHLDYADRSAARKAVQRALVATVREPSEELRMLELVNLDELSTRAWAIIEAEHPRVDHGQIIRHPDTGETLTDPMPVLRAIDRLIRISERRSKMLGLDAPKRIENISIAEIDAELERLANEIAAHSDEA